MTDQPETRTCGRNEPHPAHRFMLGRQMRQCPGRPSAETCCVCSGGPVIYRNRLEQPFCWPCADCRCGENPCVRTGVNDPAVSADGAARSAWAREGRHGPTPEEIHAAVIGPGSSTVSRSALDLIRASITAHEAKADAAHDAIAAGLRIAEAHIVANPDGGLEASQRRAARFQTRIDAARAWARQHLTAEQQAGLLAVLRGDQQGEAL